MNAGHFKEEAAVTLSSETVFSGRLLDVHYDQIQFPDGHSAQREVVRHRPAVVVCPIDLNRQSFVLVRQFRYAIAQATIECPAGLIEPNEHDPLAAAKRELQEETGIIAGHWQSLGGAFPAPGFCDEWLHFFMATELTYGRAAPDDDEELELVHLPFDDWETWVKAQRISDLKTLCLCPLALSRLERS